MILLAGCTPVIVIDDENDCDITTTVKNGRTTETWMCSGEPVSDDDMVMISMSGAM